MLEIHIFHIHCYLFFFCRWVPRAILEVSPSIGSQDAATIDRRNEFITRSFKRRDKQKQQSHLKRSCVYLE